VLLRLWEAEYALCRQLNQALGKTEVGPYHKYEYIGMSEVLSMLFECLDLWVPPVFRQGDLALLSIHRRVDSVQEPIKLCLKGCLVSDSSAICDELLL